MTQLDKDVEARFDDEFPSGLWESYVDGHQYDSDMFKQFLSKEIAKAREDERENIIDLIMGITPSNYKTPLSFRRELLKQLKDT